MNSDQLLQKAKQISLEAHKDQLDKYGAPYTQHVLRVMEAGKTNDEKIAGVLHDLVEDTGWTFERLAEEGFPADILEALKCLTKTSDDEDYEQFIERVKQNDLAIRVKLNDLMDNMDLRRMPSISEKDLPRLNKYLRAYKELSTM